MKSSDLDLENMLLDNDDFISEMFNHWNHAGNKKSKTYLSHKSGYVFKHFFEVERMEIG